MGVESYTLRDTVTLYVADSIDELEAMEDCPDHAASLMVNAGRAFLIEREYASEPTQKEVEEAYPSLGNDLYTALVEQGIYTKEEYLVKSHPKVGLPEELEASFAQECVNLQEILVQEKKPAVKLLTLAWLLSVAALDQT